MSDGGTEAGSEATSAHTAFAKAAFNATWELIDKPDRTPEDDRQMLTLAFASRWHWRAVGTPENTVVSDWQVAHVASLLGEPRLAVHFATAAYDAARSESLPDWLKASTAEGLARAHACADDAAAFERFAGETRELVAGLDDEEDRELITGQLDSIPRP
jgi:hypothetical protein